MNNLKSIMKFSKKIGKNSNKILLSSLLLLNANLFADVKLTDKNSIDDVISAMTLEEKAKLVVGIGMGEQTKINGAAGGTIAIPRLGIPEIDVADGPVGLRIGGATGGDIKTTTAFPIPTAMASTWNLEGIKRVGEGIGYETKEHGVDFILGPALNIQRDPLGGRNFEYFTEDPFLNGKVAAAYVNGVQSQGVGATLKHFVANSTETNRMMINQVVDERALREIYMPGFETAVKESNPWSIMSAYPSINGEFAAQNKVLLTDVLRDEWNFQGFVMSDWMAVKDNVLAVEAGNDLAMPFGDSKKIMEAVTNGGLDKTSLDTSVKRILETIVKTPTFNGYKASGNPDKESIIPFLREFAAESMVLLKNTDNTLPISTDEKVGLFGKNAHDFIIGGGGSSQVNSAYVVQLTEGLKNAGYNLVDRDKKGNLLQEGIDEKTIKSIVKDTDTAIVSIGRYSSEGADKYSMDMMDDEIALLKDTYTAYHKKGKKVVVLLNIGAPLEIASWEKYADAILITWQAGQEAGNAVADILSGKVNPSGKLTETFPIEYKDAPSSINFPSGSEVIYGEGIYVGYRYYDTKGVEVAYPFGHGLSYTDFDYSNIKLSSKDFDLTNQDKITVSVDVKNTGKVKGKEVVQLYISDTASMVDRPEKELKGFEKIELLPGETKTVQFDIDKRALSYYSVAKSDWVAEVGNYTVRIGSSSRDIREEISFKAVNDKETTITRDSSWAMIRNVPAYSKLLSKYIGDKEMNQWYMFIIRDWKEPLGKILEYNFKDREEFKGNPEKLNSFIDNLIVELNQL